MGGGANASGALTNNVSGVSCPSAAPCTGTGYYSTSDSGYDQTLAERSA